MRLELEIGNSRYRESLYIVLYAFEGTFFGDDRFFENTFETL